MDPKSKPLTGGNELKPEGSEDTSPEPESVFDMSKEQLSKHIRDGIRGSDAGIFVLFDSAAERGKV